MIDYKIPNLFWKTHYSQNQLTRVLMSPFDDNNEGPHIAHDDKKERDCHHNNVPNNETGKESWF